LAEELISVSRKLWVRSYVDGNGGNVSCRLGDDLVLATPTLLSKADVTPADLVVLDLGGRKLGGRRRATSETPLHLAIYRRVPQARAVVHCHPPHATAFALAGEAPPLGLIPEYEVFLGPVGVAPYRTPGTEEFAEVSSRLAEQHNTVLLSNHGMVSWADTLTHAEWLAEILDTYCHTLMAARQLGLRPRVLTKAQIQPLLELKKRLGLPDIRLRPGPAGRGKGRGLPRVRS
jgi:L-fuculose-phosphate aldolase